MSDSKRLKPDTNSAPLPSSRDTRVWFTFSGTYDHDGKSHLWNVTATNVVYEVRHKDHWHIAQDTRDDKKTWVQISKEFYALVDKSYFSNPKIQEMNDGSKAI